MGHHPIGDNVRIDAIASPSTLDRLTLPQTVSARITPFLQKIQAGFVRLLKSYQKRGQVCFEFQETIARRLGCGTRTVQKVVAWLAERRLIRVSKREGGRYSATYELLEQSEEGQLSLDFEPPKSCPSCGSPCGTERPVSISESDLIMNIQERREMFTPTVVFLRPQRSELPKKKPPTLADQVYSILMRKQAAS